MSEPFLQIRDRSWAFDFTLCAAVAMLTLTSTAMLGASGLGLLAGLLTVAPLMIRRTLPALALAVGVVGALSTLAASSAPPLCVVAVPILVYSLARFASPRLGRLALTAGLLGSLLGPGRWVLGAGLDYTNLLLFLATAAACAGIVSAAYLIGRRRREGVESSTDRAQSAAERDRLIAAEQEQRERMATVAERNRIARELHDIIAHSLSVIVVQAEGGRALTTKRPEEGPAVLGTIAETSRAALEEMRRMVGLLRSTADQGPTASYAPTPGLDDIPELVRKTSETAGLTTFGAVPPVGPALGLTAYRIIQESLTNVLKHAGPSAIARVTVAYTAGSIEIEVTDDGRGAASGDGLGHGLQGMHERVALHGGELTAQPRPGGGFEVRASLPYVAATTAQPPPSEAYP